MGDASVSSNIMAHKIMEKFGLKITQPYKNTCGINNKPIPTIFIIKDLKYRLHLHHDISFIMDIVVIVIPVSYGMLLF